MDEERPSLTAEGAAVMRAIHQTHAHQPKILDDPISPRLVDTQSDFYKARLELLERLPEPTRLRLKATFVMRSRFAEDCLKGAFQEGVRQYVMLEPDSTLFHIGSRLGRTVFAYSRLIIRRLNDGSAGAWRRQISSCRVMSDSSQ